MIGFYGIIANENVLQETKRLEAFSKMTRAAESDDFCNKTFSGEHFSIGLTSRTIGENKDLALKILNKDFLISFCGYGKFSGEQRLYWANEMIDHVAPLFKKLGKDALTNIEGSFSLLIFRDNELIILSDRMASKNIYYYETENIIIFAPDVGRILASDLVPRDKNIEGALQILCFHSFLDDSTLVKKINRFPLATLFTKNFSPFTSSNSIKYWAPPKNEGTVDKITPELVNVFSSKMDQAIGELLDLEKNVVIPLSGGLDSRAIACFVSKRQEVHTLTYGHGDEFKPAKKVAKALMGHSHYFSNRIISSNYFRESLRAMIIEQQIHSVVEQYFYTPLFKKYFSENPNKAAIFDGIYLDILFSAPYTHRHFDLDGFIGKHGRGIGIIERLASSFNKEGVFEFLKKNYQKLIEDLGNADGVGKSQLFYIRGRLSRYVSQYALSKENYCYVFKPAYNYDLMDFGFNLSLRLRKGLIYKELFKEFPKIVNIPFKDSYGIREKTMYEKIVRKYVTFRLKLSYLTQATVNYSPNQKNYFFYTKKGIDAYKDLFFSHNCISEIFTDSEMVKLFNMINKKQYFLPFYERILFLQQFYNRYGLY
jgi:hypothetical protein